MAHRELGGFNAVPAPLQNYLFRFFGDVVGLVHLLQLAQLFFRVFQGLFGCLQLKLGHLHGERSSDFNVVLMIFLGDARGPLSGFKIPSRGLFEGLQLLLALTERDTGNLQFGDEVGDGAIDFLGLKLKEHVVFAHAGAMRRGALHGKLRPFLGREDDFMGRLSLEDAVQFCGDLQRPLGDRVGGGRGRLFRFFLRGRFVRKRECHLANRHGETKTPVAYPAMHEVPLYCWE